MSKILVVEDEPAISDAVSYALREAGYDVDAVGDGAEALERARRQKYDLMVLDLLLPGVPGIEVCNTLRAERSDLPIGFSAPGPLVIEEPTTTTLVHPGQTLEVDDFGNLVIWLR